MDSNYVIQPTNDLDALNKDMYNWSLLPYKFRMLSDDKCKEIYGITNRELYNKIKEKLILNKPFDIDQEVLIQSNNIITTESFDYSTIDRRDLIMRISMVKKYNDEDITIAILYPYDPDMIENEEYKNNYRNDFIRIYNKFLGLNHKYRTLCNSYSLQLFGYNVPSMYSLIKNDILDNKYNISDDEISLYPNRSFVDSSISAVQESIIDIIEENNIIELYKQKIFYSTDSDSGVITESYIPETVNSAILQYKLSENVDFSVSEAIPYFTLSEFNSITEDIDENNSIDFNNISNSREYYKLIIELYDKFISSNKSDKIVENQLLSIGWNPYVDPRKYMNKVRERQLNWFKENSCNIIDISNYDIKSPRSSIYESSSFMNRLYDKTGLYPVYLILSYTNTTFGHIIRKVKHSTFTHAGLSLDSDFNTILTFMYNRKNKEKGFMVESLDRYLKTYVDALISVNCIFVDKNTLDKLNDSIQYFVNNKSKTTYNFKNLINILRNKAKDNTPGNLSMICSQFVDTILKLAGLDITRKSSNLVTPQDLADLNHPKIYKLYEGKAKEYDEYEIEGKIESLLTKYNIEDIKYTDFIDRVVKNPHFIMTHRYNILNNVDANNTLQELYNLISVNPIS